MMRVKAAVARRAGVPLLIEGLTLDEPRGDEVLVRLVASGVSQSDLDAIAGHGAAAFPFVPGSEGAGIVERIGAAVTHVAAGNAVILIASHDDGLHPPRAPFSSDSGPVAGFFSGQSSFATHVLCHGSLVVPIADSAPLETLAPIGGAMCRVVGCVRHHLSQPEGTIVVVGAGAAGLVAVMAANVMGTPSIIVVDPDEKRRALALELGATLAVHTDEDLPAVVRSMTNDGARLALDTTGHDAAILACRDSLAPDGLCVLLRTTESVRADARSIPLPRNSAPHETVSSMVAWQREGRFDLGRLVTFFAFEHINDALDNLASGAVVQPIIRFSIGSFGELDRAKTEGAASEVPELDSPIDEPERSQAPATVGTDESSEPTF